MLESIGDYYSLADIACLPQPPRHAVNRGIAIEGIGCIISGIFGTGNGATSFSENIGAIGKSQLYFYFVANCCFKSNHTRCLTHGYASGRRVAGLLLMLWQVFVNLRHHSRSSRRRSLLRHVCHDHRRWPLQSEECVARVKPQFIRFRLCHFRRARLAQVYWGQYGRNQNRLRYRYYHNEINFLIPNLVDSIIIVILSTPPVIGGLCGVTLDRGLQSVRPVFFL